MAATSASLNGQVYGYGDETTVEFRYYPVGDSSQAQTVTAGQSPVTANDTVDVSAFVSGLQHSTQYEFHVIAENSGGRTVGNDVTFTTQTPPVATTEPPTEITGSSAQFNGTVDPNGNETTVTFRYRLAVREEGFTVTADQSPLTGTSAQDVTAQVSGLKAGAKYEVRVVAQNDADFDLGEELTFVTDTIPDVSTEDATNVTASSARLNATVDPNGAETTVTFEYHVAGQPEQTQTLQADESPLTGTGPQSTSAAVFDLEPDRRYTFRVVAENNLGAVTGEDQSFVTGTAPPIADTDEATNVRARRAQLNGVVIPNGAQTTVVFEYGPSGQSDQTQTLAADQSPLVGTEAQSVSAVAQGLDPAREYTYRVFAENSAGTDSGSDRTFETDAVPPEATTGSATEVTDTSAHLTGTVDPHRSETTVEFEYHPVGESRAAQTVEAAESPLSSDTSEVVSATVEGLEPGTAYVFQVRAENRAGSDAGDEGGFATQVAAPSVTTDEVTQVTDSSAQLNGTVDANGLETTVEFEYFPTGERDSSQTVEAVQSPLSGNASQSVSVGVEGLAVGTEYTVQVRAENSEGSAAGAERTFSTEVRPPDVTTNSATEVTASTAQLHGTVVPNGVETSVEFEWYPSLLPGDARTTQAAESPLPANGEQSVSATVTGLTPATEYSYRVVAANEGGSTQGFERSFETLPIDVTLERSPELPERGSPVGVTVQVTEGFEPSQAQLLYRRGGQTTYQTQSLEAAESATFVGRVPGRAVTERGVEFYVRLARGGFTTTVPETSPAEEPIHVRVRVPQMESEVDLVPEQYEMISVPLRLDTTNALPQLRDDFGEIDGRVWRLLRWNPVEDTYEEVTASQGEGELTPGRAYWLITRDGETVGGESTFDVGTGTSVAPGPVSLSLPPGCSQIGNPRAYPVAWADVQGRETVNAPVAYAPSAPDSLQFGIQTLDPWSGYWVCNPGSSPTEITIPQTAAPSGSQVEDQLTEKEPTLATTLFGREPAFALQLKARLDRANGVVVRDVQNVVGVARGALSETGVEDVMEPPPVGEHVRLSVVEEETHLAGSLRPVGKDGYTWTLEVTASREALTSAAPTVHVDLETIGDPPARFERRIVDRDSGEPIPITEGSFEVSLAPDQSTRHLRMYVGVSEFVESKSANAQPERMGLKAVYPNPSNGTVFVDYRLTSATQVRVQIYDLLGRRVATVVDERQPAGAHSARWDGSSVRGTLASGTYIVRLHAGSTTDTKPVMVVR